MEVTEFIQETGRIESFFEKELTKFQRDEWYQELKSMPINRYRQIVKQTFRECKFMPKLADIVSINNELPYSGNNSNERERVECKACKGEGVIKYFKDIEGKPYEYFARCTCQNGLDFTYDGTTISDIKHRSKFYVPLITQLGLEGE